METDNYEVAGNGTIKEEQPTEKSEVGTDIEVVGGGMKEDEPAEKSEMGTDATRAVGVKSSSRSWASPERRKKKKKSEMRTGARVVGDGMEEEELELLEVKFEVGTDTAVAGDKMEEEEQGLVVKLEVESDTDVAEQHWPTTSCADHEPAVKTEVKIENDTAEDPPQYWRMMAEQHADGLGRSSDTDSDSEFEDGHEALGGDTSEENVFEGDSADDYEVPSEEEDTDSSSGSDTDGDSDETRLWRPIVGVDSGPAPIPFTGGVPGPLHPPSQDARPIDYVDLFFPQSFFTDVVHQTNLYARRWVEGHQRYLRRKPKSVFHQWIKKGPITVEEFKAFLGLTLNMGLIKKTSVASYWDSSNPSQRTPWFTDHFSRDRFRVLLKFLHFNDNAAAPDRDQPDFPLYKIQPLLKHFQDTFHRHFRPDRDVFIDESSVTYAGKTRHLREFRPNKRCGFELWCVSDSVHGYTCHFEVLKRGHDRQNAAQQPPDVLKRESLTSETASVHMKPDTEGETERERHHATEQPPDRTQGETERERDDTAEQPPDRTHGETERERHHAAEQPPNWTHGETERDNAAEQPQDRTHSETERERHHAAEQPPDRTQGETERERDHPAQQPPDWTYGETERDNAAQQPPDRTHTETERERLHAAQQPPNWTYGETERDNAAEQPPDRTHRETERERHHAAEQPPDRTHSETERERHHAAEQPPNWTYGETERDNAAGQPPGWTHGLDGETERERHHWTHAETKRERHHPAQQPADSTHSLVMRLMSQAGLLDIGHHLTVDQRCSSATLFQALYARKTTATGRVRPRKGLLPRAGLREKLKNQAVSERRRDALLCVTFQDGGSRPVLLSTAASAGFTAVRNRRGQSVQKPAIVALYNQTMGGGGEWDLGQTKLYRCLGKRGTVKWTTKLALTLMGRAAWNCYVLYQLNTADRPVMSRHKFMVSVVEGLAAHYRPSKVARKWRTAFQMAADRVPPPRPQPIRVSDRVPPPRSKPIRISDRIPPPRSQPIQVSDQTPSPCPQPIRAPPLRSQLFQVPDRAAEVRPVSSRAEHNLAKLPVGKKRICVAGHGRRVRSCWECPQCNVGLCVLCFGPYHQGLGN